ncbi:hypothetical protein N7462_003616 [Penicillium macrosclerotiorum]|uniref:uncharacterized protein n=1 Tax=Penicillium macrosclerotiorum TaxID=303699 RepID=UPI0025467613|nr:uncharacterized protein N7462_003616 [Penicillium macrosclerotiorum]KAJ5689224.1 hypothetical protein N7462_003616 [Penicillium macrosclerotiorum]
MDGIIRDWVYIVLARQFSTPMGPSTDAWPNQELPVQQLAADWVPIYVKENRVETAQPSPEKARWCHWRCED